MKTTVIHNRDSNLQEWELENKTDIYIGRINRWQKRKQSIWHNPFRPADFQGGRAEMVRAYKDYIEAKIRKDPGTFDLTSLKGKRLVCWCKPDICHGDVLVEMIEMVEK